MSNELSSIAMTVTSTFTAVKLTLTLKEEKDVHQKFKYIRGYVIPSEMNITLTKAETESSVKF